MLVRNGRSIFQNPGRYSGVNGYDSTSWIKGGLRNRDLTFNPIFSAYPSGHLAILLPRTAGALSSFNSGELRLTGSAVGVAAKSMTASGTLSISGTATMDKIVNMVASGTISLAGSSSLSAAVNASASGTLSMSTVSARLGGIFPATASGTITLTSNCRMTAIANMVASSGGVDPLSPEGIVQAVVDSLEPQLDNIQRNTDLIPVLL